MYFFLIVGDVASGLRLLNQNADLLAFAKLSSIGIIQFYGSTKNV